MSEKYSSLAEYLEKSDKDMIRMTFEEVERVIKGKLPPSAWEHRAWWSNSDSHSHARHGWLYAGYQTSKVDLDAKELVFFRTGAKVLRTPNRENYPTHFNRSSYPTRGSRDIRLEEAVRSAGGVDNLVQVTQAVQQYIDGDLLETELGRILRKLWPRVR